MSVEKLSYAEAKKIVKAKKSFYIHLSYYLFFSVFFFIINYLTSPEVWWFYWPIIGWGIGIFSHGMNVFGFFGWNSDWEEKEIENLMNKK